MSKRKRGSENNDLTSSSRSNKVSKVASVKNPIEQSDRRSKPAEAKSKNLREVIDLGSDDEFGDAFANKANKGVSTLKKKAKDSRRLDMSTSASMTPPLSADSKVESDGEGETQEFCSATSKIRVSNNNGKGNGNSQYLTPSDSMPTAAALNRPKQPEFKKPFNPPHAIPGPSSRQGAAPLIKGMNKEAPTETQQQSTQKSRDVRRAIIDVLQETLEDASNGCMSNVSDLLQNLWPCVNRMPFIFASRRYPSQRDAEDLSSEQEIKEFALWWLFGMTALLFSKPAEDVKKVKEDVKSLIRVLCQYLSNGHPKIVDSIVPQLISFIRDLTVPGNQMSALKIHLSFQVDPGQDTRDFCYSIPITEENKWAIPHFMQSVSSLFPRIFFFNFHLRHVLVELMSRLLSQQSPEPETAIAVYSCPAIMPAATYLTEECVVSIIQRLVEVPSTLAINSQHLCTLFSQLSVLQGSSFEDIGMGLLRLTLPECLHSKPFSLLYKNENTTTIADAFRNLTDIIPTNNLQFISSESIYFSKLLVLAGLDVILNPLLEKMLLAELENEIKVKSGSDFQEASFQHYPLRTVKVCEVSQLWNRIVKHWEIALSLLSTHGSLNQVDASNFFKRSSILTKLTKNLWKGVEGFSRIRRVRYIFLELKHVQRWFDKVSQCLCSWPNSRDRYELHIAVLETMESFNACNWLGLKLSPKLLTNLISIPGWPWLAKYDALFPQKYKPLPSFTRMDSSFIIESRILISKSIAVLGSEAFLPWAHFISEVYSFVMSVESTVNNPVLTKEFLNVIANVGWPFKHMSIKTIFTFIARVVSAGQWNVDSGLRSSLANAIVALPCLCSFAYRRSTVSEAEFLSNNNSGCPCRWNQDNVTNVELKCIPEGLVQKIISLASPLLESKFLLVKFQLSDLIVRFASHMEQPTAHVVLPFMQVVVTGKLDLTETIFGKIGLLLAEVGNLDNPCEYRLGVSQQMFASLHRLIVPKSTSMQKIQTRKLSKILKGVFQFVAYPVSLAIFVELVKSIVLFLTQTDKTEVTILCQRIVAKYANVYQCQPFDLVSRVRQEVSQEIIKVATKAFYVSSGSPDHCMNQQKCADFLARLCLLGEFRYAKMFINYYYPAILEKIVPKLHIRPSYRFLLSAMASHSKEIEQAVLQDWVMLYYPTLLLDHNSETVSQCLQFLKNHYGFVAIFAAKQQEQRILNEALCRLSDQRDKLLRCLPHLCKFDDDSSLLMFTSGTSKAMSISEIQELLGKRLLGFFLHLDTKLQSRLETVESKKKILRSFTCLIDLMKEKKITPLRSKVYKTLNSMTNQGPEYFKELFEAWKVFADNLDTNHFGPMAGQILAALLPLRNSSLRKEVDCLISHFVCFKKGMTKNYYHELYFLIDHLKKQDSEDSITKSEKEKVIQAIEGSVNEMKNNWLEYFMMIVKEASHENVHIRHQAFSKLLDIFRHESNFEKRVLSRGQVHISQVISTLLAGLRGDVADEKLRSLIIECLGSLGALDPVRFRNEDDDVGTRSRCTAYSGQMVTFGVLYLQELIREFQEAKDTTSFDYCACLIQQVLKEFNVVASSNDPIWSCIPPASQHQIVHLLNTKYQTDTNIPLPTVCSPVYLSEHGRAFDSWLLNWLTVLISCITTQEPRAYSLFNRNKYLLRRNSRIAAFIMPYVTMYAIFCGTEDQRNTIVMEIKTVLERWTVLDAMKIKAHSTVPIKDSQTEFGVKEELSVENESVFHFRCTQVIFSVLDHLLRSFKLAKRRWGLKQVSEKFKSGTSRPISTPMTENNMDNVHAVLENIPSNLISQVAFDCGSYTIALYYLEQELRINTSNEKLQRNLGYLQRIYVSLNDMDSVVGIAAVRDSDPSLCEIVLENIAKGKMEDCVRNLEKMTSYDPSDLVAHNALVQAYLNLDEPRKAETLIRGTVQKRPEWELAFQDTQLESLVKLKNWSELNALVERVELTNSAVTLDEKNFTWNTDLVRTISKIQRVCFNDATEILEKVRFKITSPLVAASEEMYPYKRAYHNVVQLHILTEVEDAIKLLQTHVNYIASGKGQSTQGKLSQDIKRMLTRWEARLRNVSQSRTVIDQILNVRKCLFEIMKTRFANSSVCNVLNSAIRECWLDVARDASKCGNFIRADNCLLEAKKFMSPKVLIEEAKILSRKGEKEHAITVLQKGIAQYFPEMECWKNQNSIEQASSEPRILCSKALLLLAKLCEEEKLLNMEDYIAKYKEAADVYKDSEKNHFTLGSYYDRLWSSTERREDHFQIQATVVRYYSQSLVHGCKYVYQSLPRLLSIWFDFAAGLQSGDYNKQTFLSNLSSIDGGTGVAMKPDAVLDIMNTAIKRMVAGIPAYILMTAFSQLISRLCHSHQTTWSNLKEIIVRIICDHPYQTLWMTMAVTKSLNAQRRKRCLEIYKSVEKKKPDLKAVIKDYTLLTERFLDLSDTSIDSRILKASLNTICPNLPKLIQGPGFGKVSIPFQIFLNPSLPRVGYNHKEHIAFPETLVYINDIEDNVDVMASLIRPKKLTLRASNGKSYGLMCKPKDDLRKDSKVMEVNNVVNWYLHQNTESSQRRLHVRTFSVVPLNEECGLLEWVPNLQGLRPILLSLYKEKSPGGLRNMRSVINIQDPLKVKKQKFIDEMLKPHPPVFHEWFFNNFNDHQSWYAARMAYIRTTAVMSIVGYIMGLGDRHGENILLDSVTGETVHVDFNCLFNKGETFEWIERVPFRLTQNMVDAMGPLGYEGVFRRSCEIVMNMFREHKSIFLSVLRPFVFDPLVEWNRVGKASSSAAGQHCGELTNEKAVETMKYIRHRLNGTARNLMKDINTELSVEAQVKYLIDESTSIENLCQMYIGWAAYF